MLQFSDWNSYSPFGRLGLQFLVQTSVILFGYFMLSFRLSKKCLDYAARPLVDYKMGNVKLN
jgi:hypothetical protein